MIRPAAKANLDLVSRFTPDYRSDRLDNGVLFIMFLTVRDLKDSELVSGSWSANPTVISPVVSITGKI